MVFGSSGRFFSQNNNGQNKVKGQEHQDNIVLKEWTKESTKDFKAESIPNRHIEAAAKSTQNLDAEFIPIGTKEQGHLSATEDRNTLNCRNYSSSDFANGDCANGQVAFPLEFDQCTNANQKGKTRSLHFNTNEPNKHPTKYVEPKQDCRYTKASDCGSPQGRESGMQQVSRKQKWRFEGLVDGSTMEHENVAYMNTDHRSPSCGTSSHCKAGTVSTSTDNHHSLCSKLSATSVASTKESGKASENHNLEDKYSNEMIECGLNEEMPLLPAENETDQEASMSEQNWMKLYERAVDVKDMWWLYLNDGSGSSCGLGTPIGVEKKSDERLEVNAYGLESPLRSKNSTPVKEMPRRKSSLHDELCVNDSPARLSSTEDNTMKSSNNAYRDDCSPTSKLQRLLAESRQMVASLDRNSQLPLGLSSCPTNNSKARAASISKAINSQEVPVKEKHARRIILGTHHEKGAFTFWSYAVGLPLSSSSIMSWKFCHVLHKVLRDGHPNVLQDFTRHKSNIHDMGNLWGHMHDRYGQLASVYVKLLSTKINFHKKHSEFPPNLEVTDEALDKASGTDVNNIFQLTVEMFDYMDCELKVAESVFRSLDTSYAVSQTPSGQCRLAPLIQVIQDCSHLYHYIVKLMFKLHSCLPADTLQGHRDRFYDEFHSLRSFFSRSRDMLYFKRLIQIPKLPESPPNFLRASALAEHVKPVVIIPDEAPADDIEESESLVEVSAAPVVESQNLVDVDIFDAAFGPPTNNGFLTDDRDLQIDNLKKEVELLKAELEKVKAEAQTYIAQLKAQINVLETELEETRKLKQKALVDNEELRDELESLRKQKGDTDKVQFLLVEAEKKVQANEQRYNKLKEKHSDLVNTHAELLRKSAETSKQLTVTQQTREEVARTKQELEFAMEEAKREAEMKLEDQSFIMEQLKRELEASKEELATVQGSLRNSEQAGSEMNARLQGLEAEKDNLRKTVAEKEAEAYSLKNAIQEKETAMRTEKDKASRELEELQGKFMEKTNQEQQLQQKLLDEQFHMVQGTVREAESIIQDAIAKLDDPLHIRCTSSPDYLINRAEAALESVNLMQQGHSQYIKNMADASSLLQALTRFAHLAADTIVNGSATSHLAPTDHADKLTDSCRECGKESLCYLGHLKDKQSVAHADPTAARRAIQKILDLGQELRPKSMDVRQEELGDMVDKEMVATSAAIDDAVKRIEEMMEQARQGSSGIKLEVNERILNSCTSLMKAIRQLVMASTSLQKEIVESGRGAATPKEFYAKNSRWTEGLISASKAVGWGATQLVDSADKVVLKTGKYEELIVCSHEVGASTAQLVAASKVKADRSSRNLSRLQQASRHVNEMAANVVASTKSGQEQIEDKDTMDFSGMSRIKLKKQEIETQVKVLELENKLEQERMKLGDLRKKHYELGGTHDELLEDEKLPPKPEISKKPPVSQKPTIPPKKDPQLNVSEPNYVSHLRNSQ
ncbi:huntingtin interacting protein 1 related b isoform X3 [Mobula birostris]|uniref:huntingtin interacting protein 1 related b isoform X3 n=1 Tax=Mobula birostris TaxID=1983395 RepID=UPI003B2892A6